MKPTRNAALALVALGAALAPAAADPLAAVVRDRLAPALPAELGVAEVHLPAALAAAEVDPASVAIELPRVLRAGRVSVKLARRGAAARYVPVTLAPLAEVAVTRRALATGEVITEDDVALELRAAADAITPAAAVIGATVTRPVAAGAPLAAGEVALPPPLPRGTVVGIELRRGAVRIRGTGLLEAAARPGMPAAARLGHTRGLVRGTLRAPATLVVEELP